MSQIGVYLDGYSYDLRSRNSDWSYVKEKMPRVADWVPDIRFVHQTSRTVTVRANYKAICATLCRRIGRPLSRWKLDTDLLDARELADSGCSVVFSHREYPLNAGKTPVVWMSALIDPEMQQSYFRLSQSEIDTEFAVKGELFRKAAIIQVCTESEAFRHMRLFPDIAERFVAIPLFGPHLKSAPEEVLEKHLEPETVRVLFVGNQVLRKGLPEALESYMSLSKTVRRHTTFTVVSHFDRGTITIPDDPGIVVHRGLPQIKVVELMRQSHILVNVAHHESYGMIFLEAMSQGMACLGPDWEVQRELFDEGRAGICVRCEPELLRVALLRLIQDHEYRRRLATSGWERFNKQFSPAVVSEKYAALFRSVALKNS